MQKFLILLFIVLFPSFTLAKPVIALTSLSADSARGYVLTSMIEVHFLNILKTTNSFQPIDSASLRQQLTENNCTQDTCITRFARAAEIPIVVNGSIADKGEYLRLKLYAICYDLPFNGDTVAEYNMHIPLGNRRHSQEELNLMMEEHTGRFLAQLHREYRSTLRIEIQNGSISTSDGQALKKGNYPLYRIEDNSNELTAYKYIQDISIDSDTPRLAGLRDGSYFVTSTFEGDAVFLEEFYYGRKKEMVLQDSSLEETLFAALATPLISALAPIGSPFSYHMTSDYEGLGLWAVNNTPYLYMAGRGVLYRPSELKKQDRDIDRMDYAFSNFAWYYFLAAGMSMYADAAGHYSNSEAAAYNRPQPYMGNDYTAFYLSLLGSGGGHFYKGHRAWGYLYFHTDNLLLLTAFYYLNDSQKHTESGYEKRSYDKSAGYLALGAAGIVRAIEIYHCMQLEFNIQNGTQMPSSYAYMPIFDATEERGLTLGISCERRL